MSRFGYALGARYLVPLVSLLLVDPVAAHGPELAIAAYPQAAINPNGIDRTTTSERSSGIADLKFREMFNLPVGPRGLEPSQKLLQLDGRAVRIVGYMVDQEQMRSFILAPLPLKLGDEDETLADDLPPGVVFVHRATGDNRGYKHIPGLLELTGVLSVGGFAEADDRVSTVRLMLDPVMSEEASLDVPR